MGPKKEIKKDAPKRDKGAESEKKWTIEDALNTDTWRCVVVMAVERTYYDCFVLEEFMEESITGRRQEVSLIDFDTFVMKILNDFANGELSYKYTFLMNFSSVFQEAVDYMEKKMDVPVLVLVKVVKALLFYLREESQMMLRRKEAGRPDPIIAMTERPANFEVDNGKKKEVAKNNNLKVRPPSTTKEDTKLIKRGERAKDDRCIDDAPRNAYFNLYVLLKGFYNPDFPLEMIKANIPLHAILCIDASLSGVKRESFSDQGAFPKLKIRQEEISNFWEPFLKTIWDPEASCHFKDTIFQVYVPQRLLCEKKKLAEFIYREISYLMYDLSDLKRQMKGYLDNIYLWDVTERSFDMATQMSHVRPENLPEECMSVRNIVEAFLDAICGKNTKFMKSISSSSLDYEWFSIKKYYSSNVKTRSCTEGVNWSQELEERGDFNFLNIYYKIKSLDLKYDLVISHSQNALMATERNKRKSLNKALVCDENVDDELFRSYWNEYSKEVSPIYPIDYCMYAFLMTKVLCRYDTETPEEMTGSYHSIKETSNFELIRNLSSEMRKPHFTVTDGSRSILKALPYNMKDTSRDFFRPDQFKVVTPEKLKASSAPEFRVTPALKIQNLYESEIFPVEMLKNPFENLKGFVNECLFTNTNEFDFLEFLNRPKLLEKEQEYWGNYNCIDRTYTTLNDCIFLKLHNRKDNQNINHETFNNTLRGCVGLRDFFDYVLEDEKAWLAYQEELYQANAFLSNAVLEKDSFKNFTDSDFWIPYSLKFQSPVEKKIENKKKPDDVKTKTIISDKILEHKTDPDHDDIHEFCDFNGFNVSGMTVQFSGLKTVYYVNNGSVTVQLIERLYGNQDLGIHVNEASHVLHLYSFVCPEPHVLDPFTFHVTYRNGVIVAFGRRLIETFEEHLESITTIKSKKNSSELSSRGISKQLLKTVKDEDFIYDMAASLPNGLSIRTVRRIVNPCYIKQCYPGNSEETGFLEKSRLFLPNGNVIKMMKNGTVEILKMDTSIITANLEDMIGGNDSENLGFSRFEVVTGEAQSCVYERGKLKSSRRVQVFQNTDMSTNQVFFRRKDGTDYVLQNDGSLCVQFKDGTKIFSSVLVKDEQGDEIQEDESEEEENSQEEDNFDFVFVFLEITVEHPDYATVIYESQTQKWRILLPYDSTITIEHNGHYLVNLDKETKLKVEGDFIQMKNSSSESESTFTADLSVFENKEGGVYCHMQDSSGSIFIVEANSNCYILDGTENSFTKDSQEERFAPIGGKESEISEFIASADLQVCPSIKTPKEKKLLRENKYLILRRDLTGMEVLHKHDVSKALFKKEKGSLVFTQDIPGTTYRCFVLVTPMTNEKHNKWEVGSILPNPKYEPGKSKKTMSSTYGVPPSWMHPFPKRKFKFVVPQPLSCRVFVETKKTDLSPGVGALDCYYCEMNDLTEIKHSQIPADGVEEYLSKLSNNDQDLLTEIYSLAAASIINEKKKLKPINSEKLEHYLELSRYYVAMREYHARCIRYHIIPNYFHHPLGMCWLILNQVLFKKLRQSDEKAERKTLLQRITDADKSDSTSLFSNEEIEYNLSIKTEQSFSDLSYRSDLSAETAPAILEKGRMYKCKVSGATKVVSSPVINYNIQKKPSGSDSSEKSLVDGIAKKEEGICNFQEYEMRKLEKKERERETRPFSLQDLMNLGFI